MRAVAGVNLQLPGQAAEHISEAGAASQSQTEKTGLQKSGKKTLFAELFALGTAMTGTAGGGTADAEAACEAGDPEEKDGSLDVSAVGMLVAQLLTVPAAGAESVPAAGSPGELTAAAAVSQLEQAAVTAPRDAGEQTEEMDAQSAAAPVVLQDTAEPVELSNAVVFGTIPETIPSPAQDGRFRPEQTVPQNEGQMETTLQQGNVTEKIVNALRSMGGDDDAGQSSETLLSEEKPHVSGDPKPEFVASGTLPADVPAKADGLTEKSRAVEKALDRFLNDFRGAEADGSEIKLVLEPESLGELTILVSRTENGISAKIKSEDREVCAAISAHLQKLIQAMESKGVMVENLDVVYGQTEQNAGFAQNSFRGGEESAPGGASGQKEKTEDLNDADFLTLRQMPVGAESSATVEYRV